MAETLKPRQREALLLMGLGDEEVVARQTRIVNWLNKRRLPDAQIHVFDTRHQTTESYDEKGDRLLSFVGDHAGIEVVYAISGGGPYAMSLVPVLSKDTEYCFVSAKLRNPDNIGPERSNRAPALRDAVIASEEVIASYDLSQYNITCHAGYLDGILEQNDMRIPDVPFERIHMINHSAAIMLAYFSVLRRL